MRCLNTTYCLEMCSGACVAEGKRYRTIVADPPWRYDEGWPVSERGYQAALRQNIPNARRGFRTPLPYSALDVEAIKALPVRELADPSGCHLYLWTTNRYLRSAFDVLDAWGFRYGQTLVWCKTPMGMGPGGAWAQTTEYILVGRHGSSLRSLARLPSTWFNWPRLGASHSRKPEHAMDMIETVSPAPRLEMFARTQRLGWDTWGNEALNHVDLTPHPSPGA